jgi:MFS family permease
MNKYVKTTLIFVGVWFTASLLNGVLSGISIIMLDNNAMNDGAGTLALSVIFSFVFSVPMVGLVWFITLMGQAADKKGNYLLQFVLGTALFCSASGALIFIYTLGTEFKNARFVVGLCIIISALASVLFFRKQIKTNE